MIGLPGSWDFDKHWRLWSKETLRANGGPGCKMALEGYGPDL